MSKAGVLPTTRSVTQAITSLDGLEVSLAICNCLSPTLGECVLSLKPESHLISG